MQHQHHQRRRPGVFRRDRLPEPERYYPGQGIALSGTGVWKSARCPFHEDRRPSLRVHIEAGAFRCMGCGAQGGDVLDFHMKRRQLGFIDAAKELGAWEVAR